MRNADMGISYVDIWDPMEVYSIASRRWAILPDITWKERRGIYLLVLEERLNRKLGL